MSYSARITNLLAHPFTPFEYKEGYRDARHAAASIALEAETDIVWLRAEVERLTALVRRVEACDNPDALTDPADPDSPTVLRALRDDAFVALTHGGGS